MLLNNPMTISRGLSTSPDNFIIKILSIRLLLQAKSKSKLPARGLLLHFYFNNKQKFPAA